MIKQGEISRRRFLQRAGLLGCSAAASPLLTPMSFAAVPSDNRLVVIILRGGMDGLDVVQPYGDAAFAGLRRKLATDSGTDLDGFFALHAGLSDLLPLWQKGELAFAHAVSTPYRNKRSHFDGQDLLEAGTGMGVGVRDGWLNRMLQVLPGARAQTGFTIGREEMLVMAGAAPVSNWSPDTNLKLSSQSRRLLELIYHSDPLFHDTALEAMNLADALDPAAGQEDGAMTDTGQMQQQMMASLRGGSHKRVARFAAKQLRAQTRVAAFSINGWDTHGNQKNALKRPLAKLAETILLLQSELGDIWQKTAVLAMTEFGRTVRENGTGGTDHGTGGAMLMAGGAIAGGKVYGVWPGLGETALYQGRDLMPTADVRAYGAVTIEGLFGLSRSELEGRVFPGADMGDVPGIIL